MKNLIKKIDGKVLSRLEMKTLSGGFFLAGYTACTVDCPNGTSILCMGTSSCVSIQTENRCYSSSGEAMFFSSCQSQQ